MTEWVYPVNDRSPNWGYPVTSLDFFAGKRDPGMHAWILSQYPKNMAPGDYLWVRASLPIGAFVGLGQVATDPRPDQYGATFGVVFDDSMCMRMAANPVDGVLATVAQTPRPLTADEARELHRRAGALPKQPPVAPGKIKRLQEVVARQGQQQFRTKLINAYSSTCAITGTDVVEVLQAAHIKPYNGLPSNVLPNGLLLRADIHDLFDRGLIWITPAMKVSTAKVLDGTIYAALKGRKLQQPVNPSDRPDPARLAAHRTVIASQPK